MSLTITARSVITGALKLLGVADGTAPATAEDMQTGYDALVELVDSWSLQPLTTLLQERTVYNLVTGQQDYTIGPAALAPDWSTGTAPRPVEIAGAMLIATPATAPLTEIGLTVYDDATWQAQPVKFLTSAFPSGILYTPSVPLGVVTVWPVPTTSTPDLALYTALQVAPFVSLSASYVCPPGYAKALRFNLAKVLVPDFAVPELVERRIAKEADESLSDVKRMNVVIGDLAIDGALTGGGGFYNIWSDS